MIFSAQRAKPHDFSAQPSAKPLFTQILLCIVVAGLYYFAARFGLTLAFKGTNVSPVWPPTGIALSAVMLFGYRIWPAIMVGAFLANFVTGLSFEVAFVISTGNTLEALAGGFILYHFHVGHHLAKDIRSAILFLIPVATGSTMISATIGATSLVIGGYTGGAHFNYLWWTWWLGDTVGSIVITPLILSLARMRFESWNFWGAQLFSGLLFISAAVNLLIFGPWFPEGYMLLYFTLVLIVFAAFHLPVLGITMLGAVICSIAVWGTKSGYGPFVLGNLNESLLFLQIYVGAITSTGMILTAVLNERRTALRELQHARQIAESTAAEKTVLLQELHHRVKNNLQVIVSLLNIYGKKLSNSEIKTVFEECVDRVLAIGNIHNALYGSTNLARVDLSEYIRSLAETLLNAYALKVHKIDLEINTDPVFLTNEKAITLGMILNELISNSCKHAFSEGTSALIQINLKQIDSQMNFSYTDNGKGMTEVVADRETPPIGMRLLNLLVKQINGRIVSLGSRSGAHFLIEFPVN